MSKYAIFNKITKLNNPNINNNGTLIVLMAGEGQRFVNAGYKKIGQKWKMVKN